jgi:hypothetical protein
MRNLDSCRCWRCTLCPCTVRNKFLVNFWTAPFFCVYPVLVPNLVPLFVTGEFSSMASFPPPYRRNIGKEILSVCESHYTAALQCWGRWLAQSNLQVNSTAQLQHPVNVSRNVNAGSKFTAVSPNNRWCAQCRNTALCTARILMALMPYGIETARTWFDPKDRRPEIAS